MKLSRHHYNTSRDKEGTCSNLYFMIYVLQLLESPCSGKMLNSFSRKTSVFGFFSAYHDAMATVRKLPCKIWKATAYKKWKVIAATVCSWCCFHPVCVCVSPRQTVVQEKLTVAGTTRSLFGKLYMPDCITVYTWDIIY